MRGSRRFVRALSVLLFIVLPVDISEGQRVRAPVAPVGDGEVARLKKNIAELKDQLAGEKEKNRRLERELTDLKKKLQDLSAPSGDRRPALRLLRFPFYKINALGMIRSGRTKLIGKVAGAVNVRLVPSDASGKPKSVSLNVDDDSSAIAFSCGRKGGGTVAVASLTLKPEGLYWRWKSVSPAGISDALKDLKWWLLTCVVELRSGDRVVARYQFAPAVATVPVSGVSAAIRLPIAPAGTCLKKGSSPQGWKFETGEDNRLRLFSDNASLVLTLDAGTRSLKARWEAPSVRRMREIDSEIADCEKKKEELEKIKEDAFGEAENRADLQIKANEKRIDQLKDEKAALRKRPARRPKPAMGVLNCSVDIVIPNGVVLYRIRFKR